MKHENCILQKTKQVKNSQGCRRENTLYFIMPFSFFALFACARLLIACVRLLIPCCSPVDSLLLACTSTIADQYLTCWKFFIPVNIIIHISFFWKFIERRFAVPWYTGLSPPRLVLIVRIYFFVASYQKGVDRRKENEYKCHKCRTLNELSRGELSANSFICANCKTENRI